MIHLVAVLNLSFLRIPGSNKPKYSPKSSYSFANRDFYDSIEIAADQLLEQGAREAQGSRAWNEVRPLGKAEQKSKEESRYLTEGVGTILSQFNQSCELGDESLHLENFAVVLNSNDCSNFGFIGLARVRRAWYLGQSAGLFSVICQRVTSRS